MFIESRLSIGRNVGGSGDVCEVVHDILRELSVVSTNGLTCNEVMKVFYLDGGVVHYYYFLIIARARLVSTHNKCSLAMGRKDVMGPK